MLHSWLICSSLHRWWTSLYLLRITSIGIWLLQTSRSTALAEPRAHCILRKTFLSIAHFVQAKKLLQRVGRSSTKKSTVRSSRKMQKFWQETATSKVNPEELRGNSRLQILRQVNLIAPPPPSGCPSEAAALPQPAVLLTTHDQTEGATLHQTLIPTTLGGPQEGSGNQTFITSSGITCTDFEGLNALIQEGAAEVTVVSDGGQSIAVATTAPPIFSTSQQELPKQTYSIVQGGAHPALLCPADSIPD